MAEKKPISKKFVALIVTGLLGPFAFAACQKNFHIIERLSGQPIGSTPTLDTAGLTPGQIATMTPEATFQWKLPFLSPVAFPTRPPEPLSTPQILSNSISRSVYLDLGKGPCNTLSRVANQNNIRANPCIDWPDACFVVSRTGVTEQYENAAAIIREFDLAHGGKKIVTDNEEVFVGPDCNSIYDRFRFLATPEPENRFK